MRIRLRHLLLPLLVAGFALPSCDRKPELDTDHPESSPLDPLVPTTTATSIELGGNLAGDLRRRAESGDVQSMLLLARWYEGRNNDGDRATAVRWYERAASAGDASAAETLRLLRASTQPVAKPVLPGSVALAPAPAATTGPAAPGASTAPTTSAAPGDLSKIRWRDVLATLDTKGFDTKTNPNFKGQFIVLMTAPDHTMTLAAAGATENDLDQVTSVVRIKNKTDPGTSERVQQTAVIAALVTRDNVSQAELVDWISQYINTGKRLEPIFRNGWGITVTGTAAEGIRDRKETQGTAVMIEIKR